MAHHRMLVFVLALATLLVFPASGLAAADPIAARKEHYQSLLSDLPFLQNDDGGFGPAVWADNNTALVTIAGPSAYRQTVFTTALLLEERTDPLAVHENTQGRPTSLAASHVPSARDWLRDQESSGHAIEPGDLALFALVYGMTGDNNAGRVVESLLAEEEASPGTVSARDANKILFAVRYASIAVASAHNETLDGLLERSRHTEYASVEGIAWALLARPDDTPLRAELVGRLEDGGDETFRDVLALAALALVLAGPGPDSEALLERLSDRPPGAVGETYRLLAERMAHVEFSPHYEPPPPALGGIDSVRSGSSSGGFVEGTPDPTTPSPALDGGSQAAGGEARFPIPTWAMMTLILVALGALGAVGLAWGLKREQLNGVRKTIFEYIERNPGEHFSKIRRTLGVAPGTFQHHLTVLEHEGWITSHKDARYKRYFVNGNRFQKIIGGKTTQEYKQKFSALQNPTTQDVVRYLQSNPGATQKQVAQRLNLHASTVNWHAKRLKQAGLLHDEKVGKEVRYSVDGATVEKIIEPHEEPVVETVLP